MSNAAWDALLPEGRGFVYIHDWEKYELPPGQNTTWGMIYSVALFHQMHCLGQLRRFSYMFLDAIEKGDEAKLKDIKHMFIDMDHADHMLHCFDYLRQTISCAGDMTMEWPRTEPNGQRFAVDGWGIPHECKDWVSLHHAFEMEYLLTRSSLKSHSTWTRITLSIQWCRKLLHSLGQVARSLEITVLSPRKRFYCNVRPDMESTELDKVPINAMEYILLIELNRSRLLLRIQNQTLKPNDMTDLLL